jgi:hypothetical protein
MKSVLAIAFVLALIGLGTAASSQADTQHPSGCHISHACPSDHATYRWGPKRLLCVKPTSDKRTARYTIRIRYGGLVYWCRR